MTLLFPACKFPTSSLGMPELDLALIVRSIPLPFAPWGSQSRKKTFMGTYHFFIEDKNFSALWKFPDRVLLSGCSVFVEPDWSIPEHSDYPIFLYQLYRRRYIARYWQSLGLYIVPNLSVDFEWLDFVASGIPLGTSIFATSGLSASPDLLEAQFEVACQISDSATPQFMVYGGNRYVRSFCHSYSSWVYYPFYRGSKPVQLVG